MPTAAQAPAGRSTPMAVPERHFVTGHRLAPPFPAGLELAMFGYGTLLRNFWESHDPTQGMRQGADTGTQYRSAIFAVGEAQWLAAMASRRAYQHALDAGGHGRPITTEILPAPEFFYAEDYHQQYLEKNPDSYCGIGGVGIACPAGSGVAGAAEA